MVDVPNAAARLQKNENEVPPVFTWLLYIAANILRTS